MIDAVAVKATGNSLRCSFANKSARLRFRMLRIPSVLPVVLNLVVIALVCSAVSGCSFIVHERIYSAESKGNQWERVSSAKRYPKEIVQFRGNQITLTTNSSRDVGACPISMGPPLLPIIPLFFLCFGDDHSFHLELLIESMEDDVIMDLEGLRLVTPDGKAIPIFRAFYSPAGDEPHCVFWFREKSKPVPTSPFTLGKGAFVFNLSYDKIGDPEKLTVQFDGMYSAGQRIDVPSLALRRGHTIIFCPFSLSGHEPCFHF